MDALATEPDYWPNAEEGGRRVLVDALAARYGGTAYAVVQLARHLALHRKVSDIAVITRQGSIIERGLAAEPHVRCIVLSAASHLELIRRLSWEAMRLPEIVERQRFEVVISMSGMLPRSPRSELVSLLFNPVMFECETVANRIRRWAVRRTNRRARFVAAPSRAMADLVAHEAQRECVVIPLGVDHSVFSPAAADGSELLCVADFYAHKRHDLLLDAWRLLRAPRPRLRLIGNPSVDVETYRAVMAKIEASPERDAIVVEHDVSLDRLVDAYHDARLFVMPSERESFCMPLAEAMACGVPAVARGLRSLRETGGTGARYVEGSDPQQWSAAFEPLLARGQTYQRARALAGAAAARFTWAASAATLASYF
jgi:glycosyltransferase involved in cell wall biosynthesis